MATNKYINIVVSSKKAEKNVNSLDRSMTGLGKTSDGVAKSMFSLSKVALAVSSAISASVIIKYSDAFKSLQNQIRQTTTSYDDLNERTQQILDLSNRARSSITATSELYTQLTLATENLNLSTEEQLRLTETISKSFAVSGKSAAESAGAIRQLGQAFGSGALRGDEFNSIAENAPEIMRALQRETGKTAGELREFAATGGITAELLVTSLSNAASVIDEKITNAVQTFGQATTEADNNFTIFIGRVDEATGISQSFGSSMVNTSRFVASLESDVINLIDSLRAVGAVFGETADQIVSGALPIGSAYQDEMKALVAVTDATVDFIIGAFKNIAPNIKTSIQVATVELTSFIDEVRVKIAEFNADTAFISEAVGGLTQEQADQVFDNLRAEVLARKSLKQDVIQGFFDEREAASAAFDERMSQIQAERAARAGGSAQASNQASTIAPQAIASAESSPFISKLKAETEALRLELQLRKAVEDGFFTDKEAAEIERFNNTISRQRTIFEEEFVKLGEDEVAKAELQAQFREANILAVEEYQARITEIESGAAEDRSAIEQSYSDQVLGMKMAVASQAAALLNGLVGDSKVASIALIAIEKGLAIGQTLINSQVAATRSLAELGPILGPPVAAKMLAYGKISAGLIAATGIAQASSAGGGGSLSGISTTSSATTQTTTAQVSQPDAVSTTVIDLRSRPGQTLTIEEVSELIGSIDGVTLINNGIEEARRLGEIA